ncbi:MAG: M15 family metallopeptidase [Butyrivibrio sp.]|jgi:D-alanyl-D-alanine carboxypeptidase|nr:M15 family metallopeptidase [Butyrivibrio sp.]
MDKMHQTEPGLRDRIIKQIGRIVKKHRGLFIPGVLVTALVVAADESAKTLYNNRKKLVSIICLVLFFITSSSFSYPVLPLDVSFVSGKSGEEISGVTIGSENSPRANKPSGVQKSEAELADMVSDVAGTLSSDEMQEDIDDDEEEQGKVSEEDQYHLSDIIGSGSSAETADSSVAEASENTENTFSADDWELILVNKQHPIPDDYEFPMSNIKGNMYCDKRILSNLLDMFRQAQNDGINLVICSPYRSEVRQEKLFTRKINSYLDDGMTYMNAYMMAAQAVTIPGSSEHQIGLAIDIIADDYSYLDAGFGDTDAGKWLAKNSCRYGFILRYPKGKETITGIEYEPWHFRYVGKDAAKVITEKKICLEEFWTDYIYK